MQRDGFYTAPLCLSLLLRQLALLVLIFKTPCQLLRAVTPSACPSILRGPRIRQGISRRSGGMKNGTILCIQGTS